MKKVLIIETSPMAEESLSKKIVHKIEVKVREKYPLAEFTHRDLSSSEIPHLDKNAIKAFATRGEYPTSELKQAAELSDQLIEEFLSADIIVIASPMWNFGIPSSLKAWVDHIVRVGKTFSYSETGLTGHAKGKTAILATTSGGLYSEGPMQDWDFAEPYLRKILQFVGIEDIQSVRIEGVAIPSIGENAILNAERKLEQVAI